MLKQLTSTITCATRGSGVFVLAIVAYWLACVVIISPAGNFPINDDWVYGQGVKLLCQTGNFALPTTCSACFLHVWLGALASHLFTFSYVVLRFLTLLFGLAGSIALYLALRELSIERRLATFVTLCYLANPLITNLCFSYMTDISSFAFINLYLLYMIRSIKRQCLLSLVLASMSLCASIAIRQGSVVFVAANVAVLIVYWLKGKRQFPMLLLLVLAPVVLFLGLEHWLVVSDRLSESYVWFKARHIAFARSLVHTPLKILFALLVMLGQVACYLGLYCLPVLGGLFVILADLIKHKVRVAGLWFVLASSCVVASLTKLVVSDRKLMPINLNMLRIPIVGAPNIMGVSIPLLTGKQRLVLTWLSGFSAILLLVVLAAGIARTVLMVVRHMSPKRDTMKPVALFVFCFAAMATSLFCVVAETVVLDVDRHYLLALVPVLICLALSFRLLKLKPNFLVGVPLLVLMALYSLCATQDFMSWNRARWHCLATLEKQGVKPAEIDGGAEYNFDKDVFLWVKTFKNEDFYANPRNCWRWWRVHDDKYIISFSTIPGYDVIGQESYLSGLSFSKRQVLILKRHVY